MNTRAITAAKTIKNADSNALFSNVTATTESLKLGVNGFKWDFESRTMLTFCRGGAAGGGGELGRTPEHYAHAIQPDHYKFASYGPE